MNRIAHLLTLLIVTCFLLPACDEKPKDIPLPGNEEELITTITILLKDSITATETFVTYRDIDGTGGNPPDFDSIVLKPNTTYFATIYLLDESNPSKIDTISEEVKAEANDHQFFFSASGVNLSVSYLDEDTNTPPLPIGLSTRWKTEAVSGPGKLRIVLKHQPGIKNGNEANGETDIDVEFFTELK